MTDWLPIESAPRDGSEIVGCYFKDWGDGNVSRYGPWTVAWDGHRWRSSWDGSHVIEYMSDFGTEYKEPDLDPNLWQPLPASPDGKPVVKEKVDE